MGTFTDILNEDLRKTILNKAGFIIEARAKEMVPVDRGFLKGDIQVTEINTKRMFVKVGTGFPHAQYMEFGSEPHMPPIKAIEKWAKRHNIPPWAVAMSIKKKGIKVGTVKSPLKTPSGYRPFLRPAIHQSMTRIHEMISKEIKKEISKHRKS